MDDSTKTFTSPTIFGLLSAQNQSWAIYGTLPASIANRPSHLQKIQADLASQLPIPDRAGGAHSELPRLRTNKDHRAYIGRRMTAWLRAKRARGSSATQGK